jgi:hypothetical protein
VLAALLFFGLLRPDADAFAPKLVADLDGDGREETVTASARRGGVTLEVRGAAGTPAATAKVPAPPGDVIHVGLLAGAIGSAGTLVEVQTSTDATACLSVWRYRDAALARLPLHDARGKDVADCAPAGMWSDRWESEGPGRPSHLVRERAETTEQGTLRVTEVFAFSGFSLDRDATLSKSEIEGIRIPDWADAVFYSTEALEILYGRYDLSRLRGEPTAEILADRRRGVFALRLSGAGGTRTLPIVSVTQRDGQTFLGAASGGATATVAVRLGGPDTNVPLFVQVSGLGGPYDEIYGPAGSYHGRARKAYRDVAAELIGEYLTATWVDPKGGQTTMDPDAENADRLRVNGDLYEVDLAAAEKPLDAVLRPASGAPGPTWGIVLRGKNMIERVPVTCEPETTPPTRCRAHGAGLRLRRLGARANLG